MKWMNKNSQTSYLDFIDSIEGCITTNPIIESRPKKSVFIRHDVDYNIDHALMLAEYEHEHNIQATYFLLHTAPYFDYSTSFAEKVRRFEALGHRVGFHNDILSIWHRGIPQFFNLIDIVLKPLSWLRGLVDVKGTSAHGAVEHYDREYFNYQLWTQWTEKKNEGFPVRWPQMSLYTPGFLYEAYFLPYTHYFSDSGNNCIGYTVKGAKPFERAALFSKDNLGTKVINEFNRAPQGFFQVLIHPCHWLRVTDDEMKGTGVVVRETDIL